MGKDLYDGGNQTVHWPKRMTDLQDNVRSIGEQILSDLHGTHSTGTERKLLSDVCCMY